jgi:hypothetical protein
MSKDEARKVAGFLAAMLCGVGYDNVKTEWYFITAERIEKWLLRP